MKSEHERNVGTDDVVMGRCRYFASVSVFGIGFKKFRISVRFLADRTIGRAFGTMCRLSVCRTSVTFCIVAKRYVLAKKCLKQ